MNFDAWVDDVGAQAPDLRATGQVVTQALADKAKAWDDLCLAAQTLTSSDPER